MHKVFILVLIVLSVPEGSYAQILKLDAGVSNETGSGAGATVYLGNQTISGGMAYIGGNLYPSLSDRFIYKEYLTTIGTNALTLNMDGGGIFLAETGISLERRFKDSSVTYFIGAVGQGFNSEFLQNGVRTKNVGAGSLYRRTFGNFGVSGLGVVNGDKYTGIAGGSYNGGRLQATAAGGILQNQRYVGGYGSYLPSDSLSFNGGHQQYFYPYRASLDTAGANYLFHGLRFRGSVNQSKTVRTSLGESIGIGTRWGLLGVDSSYYHTPQYSFVYHVLTEHLGRHLQLVENVTQSSGHNSMGFGGSYYSNRFSVGVNQSIQYQASGRYTQVTSINFSIRIHDTVLRASSITDNFGRVVWSTGGEDIRQVGEIRTTAQGSMSVGKYLIEGVCSQPDGTVVEGCVLEIGHETVISDSHGRFEYRSRKNKPSAIVVKVEDFLTDKRYKLVSAAETAIPGTPILVVVSKI